MRRTSLLGILLALGSACTDAPDEADIDESAAFEQAYEEAQEPGKTDGSDCSGVRVPDRGGFAKRVALTFDDGPNPNTTPRVIEVLKAHRAPATFFINGSRLATAGATELAARIAADPDFLLGNHSQRHLNFADLSLADAAREMDRTAASVTAAGEPMTFFRFPFGSSTCQTMDLVRARGWRAVGWHIDSADWCFAKDHGVCTAATFKYVPDSQRGDLLGYVLAQLATTQGGIILFHDIHPNTADNLDRILTRLEQEGYTFVRVDDVATFPLLNGVTPPFIGDACAVDADCGFLGGTCGPGGFCTQACAGTCPDRTGKAPTFCIANPAVDGAGMCAPKSSPVNASCASLPGTESREVDRFLGTSSSRPARAVVCAPR